MVVLPEDLFSVGYVCEQCMVDLFSVVRTQGEKARLLCCLVICAWTSAAHWLVGLPLCPAIMPGNLGIVDDHFFIVADDDQRQVLSNGWEDWVRNNIQICFGSTR